MPVEFISSTNFGPSTGVRYSGFDPDYARRYVRMLDDGGFDWTLVGYDSRRVDSVTQDYAGFVLRLVRQELARRDADGSAPILNPDSTPTVDALHVYR
jgi:hypothetical protein